MNWNTWLRFKMRAIFEYSVRAHWSELQDGGYVYVDDDTPFCGTNCAAEVRPGHGALRRLLQEEG